MPQQNTGKNKPQRDDAQSKTTLPVDTIVEQVEGMPPAQQEETIKRILISSRSELFAGPIPPPDVLKAYGEVVPEAPKIIIDMAVAEQQHRHKNEDDVIKYSARDSKAGIITAFTLSMTTIVLGFIAIILGHAVGGTVFASFGVGSVVIAMLKTTRPHNNQKEDSDTE